MLRSHDGLPFHNLVGGKGRVADLNEAACAADATACIGRVLVAGGSNDSCHNPNGCGIRASELFDPITETWSDNAKMSFSRYYPSNVLLPDGTSITLSGNNATGTALIKPIESWDPSTGAWTRLPASANIPVTFDLYPRMVVLPRGKLFNAGPQPDTWMFDPSSKSWSLLANMNAPYRSGEGMVPLPGLGKVLVAGGRASGGGLRTAEIIDRNRRYRAQTAPSPVLHFPCSDRTEWRVIRECWRGTASKELCRYGEVRR